MKRRSQDELAPPASPFSSRTSNKRPSLPSSSTSPPSEFLLAKALFEFSHSRTTITRNLVNNNNNNSSTKRATTATQFVPASSSPSLLPYPRLSSPESPSLSGSKSGSQPIRPPGTPPPPSLNQSAPSMTQQIHKLAMDQLLSHLSRDPALLNKLVAAIITEVQQQKKKMVAKMELNTTSTTATIVQPSSEKEIQEAMCCLTGNNNNTSTAAPSQREQHNTLGNTAAATTATAATTINQSQQKQQQFLSGVSEDMSEDAKNNRRLEALKKLEALKHKLEARLAARRKFLIEQKQPSSTLPSLSAQTLVPLSDSMESYIWPHTSLPQQQQPEPEQQQMVSSQTTTDSGCDSLSLCLNPQRSKVGMYAD